MIMLANYRTDIHVGAKKWKPDESGLFSAVHGASTS